MSWVSAPFAMRPPTSRPTSGFFTPLVDRDVAEAYAWYEAARSNLGEEFLRDINGVLDVIVACVHQLRHPRSWRARS
jgi:hypothetical protein